MNHVESVTGSSRPSTTASRGRGAALEPRMRAAVLVGPRRIELREAAVPEPGPRQVRVRLEGCGVCGSNLPTWEGREWFRYPLASGAPGHEGWGHVDAAGGEVRTVKEGDRVAFLGGAAFADYDLADEGCLVKLPDALDGLPFPGEPLGCAVNVFRRSEIHAGQTVAVIGIGFLGAVVTRLAAMAGARVVAITRRRYALEVAREMGAHHLVPLDDHYRVIDEVKAATGGALCDRVIEAVGEQWPLDLAGELCRERGRLIVAGYHQDGPRRVNMQLWNWRGLDVVNAHEREPKVYLDGIRRAAEMTAEGRLDPRPLLTHAFPLERIEDAFDALETRPDGFMKALVTTSR